MQKLLGWTLDTIRQEESDFSWMEEYRYDWAPLIQSATSKIISGQTLLVVTDKENNWFGDYIISKINSISNNRPFLPIYLLKSTFPNLSAINSTQEIELLEDMLDISYPNGYFIVQNDSDIDLLKSLLADGYCVSTAIKASSGGLYDLFTDRDVADNDTVGKMTPDHAQTVVGYKEGDAWNPLDPDR